MISKPKVGSVRCLYVCVIHHKHISAYGLAKVIHPKYYDHLTYDLATEMGSGVQYKSKLIIFIVIILKICGLRNPHSK